MSRYDSFFTDEAILKVLCKQRIDFCRKTHEKEFLDKISPKKNSDPPDEALKLMPSRSKWKRAPKHIRNEKCNSHLQNDLYLTVQQLRKQNSIEDRPWIQRQDQLIESIRTKALAHELLLAQPKIIPIPKNTSKSEYRIVASYKDDLVDSIVIRQCANYLRREFDDYFLDCSFAFRSPRAGKPTTHHDAFEQLAIFWKNNQKDMKTHAWIAECDIQGFYDIIDHKVILSRYDEAVLEQKQNGVHVDERARCVVLAYLDSYTYNHYGRPTALSLIQCSTPEKVKDRDCTLKKYWYPGIKYGVPQGGALSVFFANLILHKADLAVTNILRPYSASANYVRYCDDMVIASHDRELTKQAFSAYTKELDDLNLIPHPPKPIAPYSGSKKRDFWETKTKEPYLWGNNLRDRSAIPWLAFVGYWLRYDGMVKIRPKSLTKELVKQHKTREKFLQRIEESLKQDKPLGFSKSKLMASLEGRLRASAIGKRPSFDLTSGMSVSEFGWCAGFKKLVSDYLPELQTIAQGQLRRLDRGLHKQLTLAKKTLAKHPKQLYSDNNSEEKKTSNVFRQTTKLCWSV